MALQLDGGNTIIGTDFIKLLATGSSNLATESYVNTAVANGGGGGGGGDLTNYYDKTEVDNLLTNKLNKDNPQDMSGTLRIGHVAGTSKIILNALASDKDFYVNGDGEIGGNMTVLSLDSSGYIQGSSVLTTEIDTGSNANLDIQRNNVSMIELEDGKTIFKTATECRDIFYCDHFENEPLSPIIHHIMNEPTGQIKYYVGSPAVPDTVANLIMVLKPDKIEINKPIVLSDVLNTNTIDSNGISDITFKRNTFDICYLKNCSLELNAGINLVAPAQIQANIYNSFDDSSVLLLGNGEEFMRFRKTEDDILVSKDIQGVNLTVSGEVKSNALNSDGINDIVFKRNNTNKLTLTGTEFKTETGVNIVGKGEVKCNTFNSDGNSDVSFKRNGIEYMLLNNDPNNFAFSAVEFGTGICLITEKVFTDQLRNKNNANDFLFYGGNSSNTDRVNYLTYRTATEDVIFL